MIPLLGKRFRKVAVFRKSEQRVYDVFKSGFILFTVITVGCRMFLLLLFLLVVGRMGGGSSGYGAVGTTIGTGTAAA